MLSREPTISSHCFAALGLRSDGDLVLSRNGGCPNQRMPLSHAEARLCRKLDVGSYVYVARTLKDGTPAMARPCRNCERLMRSRGVARIYYTIGPGEYGVMTF
jgi:hypothetical protein